MKFNLLTATMFASGLALFAGNANAAVTTDSHGNVGYDSYDECVAAVKSGDAKFYTPYTYQKPKLWNGEASVKQMKLSEVTIPQDYASDMPLRTQEYTAGACDLGVGKSNGRYGVSGKLVGKYVPFAPDMPVNVYMDRMGTPVRVTMQQCDNHFGGKFPTPVISELKAPPAQLNIDENRSMEVVTTKVRRTVKPVSSYAVKEVIMVPADQVRRVKTADGTVVVLENEVQDRAVVIGQEASDKVIRKLDPSIKQVPVTTIPSTTVPSTTVPVTTVPARRIQ